TIDELFAAITEDEARHAQLSWRVVAWLIAQGGHAVQNAVDRAFADAALQPEAERLGLPEDEAYGVLCPATAAELRRQAFRDVIEPCRRRLFDSRRCHAGTSGGVQHARFA
ncbi:MAG TPA: hypothetical protein VIV60_36420, partial [Polyangiaceae bacterium]